MPEAAANLLRVHLREYPRGQAPEVYEPAGILLIIDGIFAEGGQVLPVERMRGRSPHRRAGALKQFDPHGARHGIGGGPIEGRGYAALERDLDVSGVIRSRARRPCQRVDILRWLLPWILQHAGFGAAMPEILVDAVRLLPGRRDWNPVRRRVLDFVFARSQRPLPPRSDDSQVRG